MEKKDNFEGLTPAFSDNFTTVAMSSSDEYLPYLAVSLQSLVDNSSNNHNYDIVIFSNTPMSSRKQTLLDKYNSKNISLRFYNPREILSNIKK